MNVYLVSLIAVVVCFLYYYFTRTFDYWKRRNVKGPSPIPVFGNFLDVFLRKEHVGVLYSDLYKQYPNEKVVGLYRMMSPTLLIRDLDIVKQVLIKDFDSFPDRGLYYNRDQLGDNLFHSDVEVMKTLRKHLTAVFTSSKFKANFSNLAKRADMFIDYIENETMKNSEMNTLPIFRKYAVDSIMMGAFGIDVDPYNNENELCDMMDAGIQTPSYFLELELTFPGTLSKYSLSIFPERVARFCREVIQAGVNQDIGSKTEKNRTMDVLMSLRQEGNVTKRSENEEDVQMKITDTMLAAQVFIFYFAGYGNNSLMSTYALYHLARNPDIQETLIQEIDEVLEKHNGEFTYDALKDMKYLQMVFEETLRMHPLTNSVARCVGRDIQLDGTDFIINKNTILAISPYGIQHDEKYYPEPEKFIPERFSPENSKERHPCAMVSFGAGPRSCLGSRFAHLQFGICMVKFFSKYRVECTKNTVGKITYTPMRLLLTPKEKIYLRLVRR